MEEINKKEVNRYLTEKMGRSGSGYFCDVEGDLDPTCVLQDSNSFTVFDCCEAKEGMVPEDCNHWSIHVTGIIDLFSPEGFFILLDWAKGEDWWYMFTLDVLYTKDYCPEFRLEIINPEVFPIEVYNYLRGREK